MSAHPDADSGDDYFVAGQTFVLRVGAGYPRGRTGNRGPVVPSNGTVGSEFTGLFFDIRNPNRAFVNIQHPASGVDRLIEISASPQFERGSKKQ